jgi:cyclophilin family peptidyl-prolyl cis-trans isomerase/HEAT repeat protein
VPVATTPARPQIPAVTWEEKLSWIMRLENQRILRDPNPPARAVLVAAAPNQPAVLGPPAPSDLVVLLKDPEGRVRRRAVLAAGRTGLLEAVAPVSDLLKDPEPEVRQAAAFALGLLGSPDARAALTAALSDTDAHVQGRAAEALGLIGDRADATAVSAMVRQHIAGGALTPVAADDLTYPMAPAVEAVRLGVFALARLGSYEALAAAVLEPTGRPVSAWWPVAFALQRIQDPRTMPALASLLSTPSRYTASFAARGLGASKSPEAAQYVRQVIEKRSANAAVVIQALRAVGLLRDASAEPLLVRLVSDVQADPTLRVEAMAALAFVATDESFDLMLDLLSDSSPAIRAAALRALARIDPDGFLVTLSGMEPDPDWTVRSAEAEALGTLPGGRGLPRLTLLTRDRDVRVIPAALNAIAASKAQGAEGILVQHLKADDFAVRAAAANGLAALKATGAAGALSEAYRATLGDRTYVARAAILTALNAANPTAAQPFLQEALKDPEWAVRVRAAALLRERGSERAALDAYMRPAPPSREMTDAEWKSLLAPPYSPHAFIDTDRGTIEIELAIADAPLTVASFVALARRQFFDGVAIHRVVPDFVVQDGDPRGDGEGGPGYTIRDEINMRPYLRGTVGMALDWADTGGSQFFITHSPQPHLDARYTVFGHVVAGMEVVDALMRNDVIRRVRIWDGVTESR